MKKYSYFAVIIMAALSSCKPEFDEFKPSAGDANFSTYVSLGNSLTAGYTDQALYKSGQENSYPNLLAMQFQKVGGGEFKQPLVNDEMGIGFSGLTPIAKLTLQPKADCKGVTSLSPAPAGPGNLANLAPIGSQGPFNNMGVPGAKSFHLITPGYGSAAGNPFFARFASSPTTTILADAIKQQPTFFSLWIGNNDILTFGLAGGEADSITSPSGFEFYLNNILQSMTANGSKGVIATIPDVTVIPFFNTIPYNALVLTDENQVNQLNAAYAALGIKFNLGQNALIIEDTQAPGGLRQIKKTEKFLLTTPQDSIKCYGWGSQKPIPDEFVLDEAEISALISAAESYNGIIKNMANKYNLALADANQQLGMLESGLSFDAVTLNTTFASGGFFALDGIHLTPRGNAVVANIFIGAINDKYKAQIPLVDITKYRGVAFP